MRFIKYLSIIFASSILCSSCNTHCSLPVQEAIKAQLNGDSLVSYEVLNKVDEKNSSTVSYSALVMDDSSSQPVEKKGIIKFNKTGDGLWVYGTE